MTALKLGDRISDAQKEVFWKKDSAKSLSAALEQMREAGITDLQFVLPLADVNFQLGRGWRSDFKKTWALMKAGKYEAASKEVQNSKWFRQTPHRVEAFRNALSQLAAKQNASK